MAEQDQYMTARRRRLLSGRSLAVGDMVLSTGNISGQVSGNVRDIYNALGPTDFTTGSTSERDAKLNKLLYVSEGNIVSTGDWSKDRKQVVRGPKTAQARAIRMKRAFEAFNDIVASSTAYNPGRRVSSRILDLVAGPATVGAPGGSSTGQLNVGDEDRELLGL